MSDSNPWGSKETSYFYELTPDRILNAVEHGPYRCTGRCLPLNSMENRVYEVEIDCETESVRSAYDRFKIVKFYRPGRWNIDQIQEEHDFLRDLAAEEIPVVAPEPFEDGSTIKRLDDAEIYYTVFPKVGGRNPDEMSDEQLGIVGRLLARLHNVGQSREANHRIPLDHQTYGESNLRYLIDAGALPIDLESTYRKTVESILEASAGLFDRFESQRIHGDCHLGNLLWGQNGPFWVDFDDMVRGPRVQDIWLVCPGREGPALEKRDTLIAAYETMSEFDPASVALVEPLRALRFVHFSAWIGKRWKDPAFPRAFPDYNSWDYWNGQVRDLAEQLQWITGGPRTQY